MAEKKYLSTIIAPTEDKSEIFYGSQFCMFAVRCNKDKSVGQRKLRAGRIYNLFQGYEILTDEIRVYPSKLAPQNLYNDYLSAGYGSTYMPNTTLSVVVGENGAGKSTLLEYIVRLVNNFSAALIGEYEIFPGAEHLHFIEGMCGDFYFMHRNNACCVSIEDNEVEMKVYCERNVLDDGMIIFSDCISVFHRDDRLVDGKLPLFPIFEPDKVGLSMQEVIQNLFYSFVSNYSLYAYNTNDYADEISPYEIEYKQRYESYDKEEYNRLLLSRGEKAVSEVPAKYRTEVSLDERCWLRGLFHKNDGYQTPVVLSPFRSKGCMDVNKENALSRERLIELMLHSSNKFRTINGHLDVIGFRILGVKPSKKIKQIQEKLGWGVSSDEWDYIHNCVLKSWGGVLREDFKITQIEGRSYIDIALDYLVFKTIKIAATYWQYHGLFVKMSAEYASNSQKNRCIKNLVKRLAGDYTHVTKKLRQTIAYILGGVYDKKGLITIDQAVNDAEEWYEKYSVDRADEIYIFVHSSLDAAPPPFLNVEIVLKDRISQNDVSFDSLSSGEKQQAYSISAILYHLDNINSVHFDDDPHRIRYDSVFVVLEEIELYFHPELQKSYIRYLLDGIRQLSLNAIRAIHICLVTHSPFILSDVPHTCVLPLKKDDSFVDESLPTFAGNIYELLKNSFFMTNGTIGSYAQVVIDKVLLSLKTHQWVADNQIDHDYVCGIKELPETFPAKVLLNKTKNVRGINNTFYIDFLFSRKDDKTIFSLQYFLKIYTSEKIKQLIQIIDEPMARHSLNVEYLRTFPDDRTHKTTEIEKLKRQIDVLERM